MKEDTVLTEQILEALGFKPGKWKSAMISDYRAWFLEDTRPAFLMEYEGWEAGNYGGFEVEASAHRFSDIEGGTVETIGELAEVGKRKLHPDDILTLLNKIKDLP